ncbi:cupin [Leptothoe spongobia TAU-MAC 1115]|uniref:Cupin n=2 Tax=Leptothoe TaxID=2651725 RepID=A0A947GHY8_9CYAN|nr:cupin [Leptothoe spongobia TAU-MAC 1115]
MQSTLTSILRPYSLEKFLSENWAQQGIIIPGECSDKFQHLFSWKHLNHLLNFHQLEPRFVLNGKVLPTCDPKHWITQCQTGASLVLSHVDNRIPELTDLVWAIQQEMGHSAVHANIYCSWPSQQGFHKHFDAHEVLVMQIEGQKEWFVFEDTHKYPFREENSDNYTPPNGEPYIHHVLNPGDLLYIPRGHWHCAIAREQPSLHVTLGIRCFTGRDALTWLFKKLQAELQSDEGLRQNLPLMPHGQTHLLEAHVQQIFDDLSIAWEREKTELAHDFATSQLMTMTLVPEISLPSQAGFNIFEQELDTRLRQRKYQPIQVESLDEGTYLIVTPQKTMKFKDLPPSVIDTLIKNVFSQESFTIRDVAQQLSDCDLETMVLPLLAGLVKEGILIEDTPSTAAPVKTEIEVAVDLAENNEAVLDRDIDVELLARA